MVHLPTLRVILGTVIRTKVMKWSLHDDTCRLEGVVLMAAGGVEFLPNNYTKLKIQSMAKLLNHVSLPLLYIDLKDNHKEIC